MPGTRVIASVPNIRNLATLSDIAGGRFEYQPNGVLDITHVRFFTRSSLRELFEQTGFDVRGLEPLTQPAVIDPVIVNRRRVARAHAQHRVSVVRGSRRPVRAAVCRRRTRGERCAAGSGP
jgi:hypothetical protein